MAGKSLNAWAEMSLAIKEGRYDQPPSLLTTFMAMPKLELAQTAVHAVGRIAALKNLMAAHKKLDKSHERINALNEEFIALLPQLFAEDRASSGGKAKAAKNPINAAKMDAFNLWLEREAGRRPDLRTEDQFAIKACRQWPALKSIGTVKKWSTQWRKEAKAKRAK